MIKSSSKSSLFKRSLNDKYFNDHNKPLFDKIQSTLQQASHNLSFQEFHQFFHNILRSLIHKIQHQNPDTYNIQYLKSIATKYNPNLQLSVKLILLQVKYHISIYSEQSLNLLNKAKHMIIDTQFQYLLPKIFILEAKVYQTMNIRDLQIKSLFKSINFAQNFVLQYLNQRQNIRKQIVQNIVIAYFQLYKIKRQQNHIQAQQYLRRAQKLTQKNYGQESQVTQMLNIVLNDHQNIRKGLQKMTYSIKVPQIPQRALTQIIIFELNKNTRVEAFYSWQQQKIMVQLIKQNQQQDMKISQTQYSIKLDMSKINLLRNSQWIKIYQGEIQISQDQIFKYLNIKNQNTATTRIGIKNISRQEIIKKDSLSSSSSDPSFIQKEDFNFIRKLGRAQSAKRQLNI